MKSIRKILVIIDPLATEFPVLAKTARLAKAFGSSIELYACDTRAAREARLMQHAGAPGAAGALSLQPFLDGLAGTLREQGIEVTAEVDVGDPLVEKLCARVKQSNADLVIKDTHHHSIARRTFFSNTDWQLIRSCVQPLLLIKPQPWPERLRVVAAVDPGHVNDKPAALDQRILDYGASVAGKLEGELHALHAYIPVAVLAAAISPEPASALGISDESLAREREQRRREVAQLVAPFVAEPARIHIETGGPGAVIPHAASQLHASIMVMGAVARSGLKKVLIGSTAEAVLERLPCDVLVIKPLDFADALPM